jgi:hypothetical protein
MQVMQAVVWVRSLRDFRQLMVPSVPAAFDTGDEGVQMKRAFVVKLVVLSQAHTCSEQPPPAQVSLQPPRNIGIALDMATQLCGRNFSPGGVSFKSEI